MCELIRHRRNWLLALLLYAQVRDNTRYQPIRTATLRVAGIEVEALSPFLKRLPFCL
jgi:hypothetical protein